MQKKIKYFVIQGNFGYGWEDESFYSMGKRQADRRKAYKEAIHDINEYRIAGGMHRLIERYETEEE